MIAIFLCAGYATRLYPLSKSFPKSLLPVADTPVIDYLAHQIAALRGIKALHVVTNGRFNDHFMEWADRKKNSTRFPIPIHIHNDGTLRNADRLGAVADLDFTLRRIKTTESMLVAAADNIFRFSIAEPWNQFLNGNCHMVLALPQNERRQLQKTGVLELDNQSRVLRLHEKPEKPPSNLSCPPLYFMKPSAQRHLRDVVAAKERPDAPGFFIDYLCQQEWVTAYEVNGQRLDIGDMDSYHQADQCLRNEPLFI